MLLQGGRYTYNVAGQTAATSSYRLRLAEVRPSGDWCLLQVANDRKFNGDLSRAAYILDELARVSNTYDERYQVQHEGKRLHYDRLFPRKLESFVTDSEQGSRRVNALTFTDVSDVPRLLPLSVPRVKHNQVLDLKTGAWVMGRLLKLLGFVHEQGIAVRSLRPNNILLDTEQHYAVILDWTTAQVFQGKVSSDLVRTDIIRAAEAVLTSCGVSPIGDYPYALNEGEDQYINLLRNLAEGEVRSASEAHARFYQIVRDIWETELHPFTTLSLIK